MKRIAGKDEPSGPRFGVNVMSIICEVVFLFGQGISLIQCIRFLYMVSALLLTFKLKEWTLKENALI